MTISEEKQRLRKEIAWQKKQYPAETVTERDCLAEEAISGRDIGILVGTNHLLFGTD